MWRLTPLTARTVGAWLVSFGIAAGWRLAGAAPRAGYAADPRARARI